MAPWPPYIYMGRCGHEMEFVFKVNWNWLYKLWYFVILPLPPPSLLSSPSPSSLLSSPSLLSFPSPPSLLSSPSPPPPLGQPKEGLQCDIEGHDRERLGKGTRPNIQRVQLINYYIMAIAHTLYLLWQIHCNLSHVHVHVVTHTYTCTYTCSDIYTGSQKELKFNFLYLK